jgi:alkylation response protein AidB-like acyl-CoA dehydrogenase
MNNFLENVLVANAAFREEVCEFLARNFSPELRAAAAEQSGVYAEPELAMRWHRILYQKGWVAAAWPRENGGTGWSASQRLTFETECALAGAPVLPAMGLQMCGPILISHGTPEQKAFFLPKILSGEHYWCQGYSEPGAGSDLASLKCRAIRESDTYVINGSKIWTTHAHYANWIFLLVRTDSTSKQQAGITFLLAPMNSPGISVTPILSTSGEHEVNQVFFEDVRVPLENRVGEENDGWRIAKHLLEFERGGGSAVGRSLRLMSLIDEIAASERDGDGGLLSDDPFFRRQRAELEIEIMATDWTQRRFITGVANGRSVGNSAASILKLKAAECLQRATELALDSLGPLGMVDQNRTVAAGGDPVGPDYARTPAARYFNGRAMSIFGGSAEILKTIIAREALQA